MSSKKIGVGAVLFTSIWASCAFAEITPFERGQLWECTVRHETASPDERLQFLITGIATEREVSRRPNFQNDKPVISVALTDLDPLACSQAKRFLHMAYSERALRACAPTLVDKDNRLAAPNGWKAARNARGRWLIEMQSNKGVIIDLNPSRFLSLLKRKRCQTPQTDGE